MTEKLLPAIAKVNGEIAVDLHLLDEPLVDGIIKRLPDKVEAVRFARLAIAELFQQIEPQLKKLAAENEKLRKALAFYYYPTSTEIVVYNEHCHAIFAAGGTPPDESDHWASLALFHWERENERNAAKYW